MAKFVIEPHFRLQEWVAEEKGYFRDEGLDYVFRELVQSTDGRIHDQGDRVGAYQSFEKGRAADVSCACHWTVGVAASSGHGKLYSEAYSVAPAGVFVPADSAIKSPEDLAAVQRRREFPTRMTQRMQLFLQTNVLGRVLASGRTPGIAWPIRLMQRFPVLRRIPARLIGLGFRPEHVRG